MKIYLSSTYQDLVQHRQAVATVLRRMGHQPVGMEEYVAEGVKPLNRCLEDVQACHAFIGILAWRYGYVPSEIGAPDLTLPADTALGETSITEFEFRQAVACDKRPLMFLLDPKADWPAHYFDAVSGDGLKGQRIADLRSQISQGFLVSFFRSPDDLASLASAAIYRREMDRQMKLESLDIDLGLNQPFTRLGPMTDSTLHEIRSRIATPEDIQALQINLGVGMDWWSTRLYFIASLAADLTDIHVIVFVDASDCFVGMATPSVVKERLAQAYAPLRQYERAIGSRRAADIQGEVDRRAGIWETTMGKKGGEEAAKVFVTKQELRRWLGSYLIEQAIEWQADDSSAWQMQRLVDWPMRFVPITDDGKFIRVVDRQALTDQVARLFIKEQVSRSRSMFR